MLHRRLGSTGATLVVALGALLFAVGGCSRGPRLEIGEEPPHKDVQQIRSSFDLKGPNSIPFVLFNVTAPGRIRAEVVWAGRDKELSVALLGRRRPELDDPTAPYAQITGASPLKIAYKVTAQDVARGVSWRLVVSDTDDSGTAQGTVSLMIPFDASTARVFERERIAWRAGDLWPNTPLQTSFEAKLAATTKPGLHGIISLKRAVDCKETRQLERLGLIRQSYLPGRHSFGYVRKGIDMNHPLILSVLRRITPLDPEDKVDPFIWLGDYARFVVTPIDGITQNYVLNDDGTLELSVLFARDVSLDRIKTILNIEAVKFSAITDSVWQSTVEPAKLSVLAAYDEVGWIEAGPLPFLPDNDFTRQNLNVDTVQSPTINVGQGTIVYGGLTGADVTVGVCGSGIDASHPDLNVVVDRDRAHFHTTFMAGTIGGSGIQSNKYDANGNHNEGTAFQWRGIAPKAGIVELWTYPELQSSSLKSDSVDLINHSHSTNLLGPYSVHEMIFDDEIRGIWDTPRIPHIYSAGNNGAIARNGDRTGYFSITNQMKNSVLCGAWDVFNECLAPFSSMGPSHDGRTKPDVVAPGTWVKSTGTTDNEGHDDRNGYMSMSGTSVASAAVAGVNALLLEAWQTNYNTPVGTTLDANPPLPSTLRALLIHTAVDIVSLDVRGGVTCVDVDPDHIQNNGNDGQGFARATVGPDFATGWGLVDAQAAVDLLEDWRTVYNRRIPNRIIQDAISQGGINEYDFVVDQVGPLRVTLAWDDANWVDGKALINDLDLELVDPNGTIHYPWQLGQTIRDLNGNVLADNAQPPGTDIQVVIPITPNPDAASNEYIPSHALWGNGVWVARKGKDHLNNVEQVSVHVLWPNQIGRWTLRVLGFDVRVCKLAPQDYSVVGFPYPDLAELEVFCTEKVGLSALNTPIAFTWTVKNTGVLPAGGSGEEFDYQIWLSRDFFLDNNDVALVDTNQRVFGALPAGEYVEHTSNVQITQANANALLGPGTTIQQLQQQDVFLLVQVDSNDVVLEHRETNVAFVQLARPVDVVLVMDKSGSMSGTVLVSNGTQTKIEILKDSVNLFLDLLRKGAGDELAEVSFSSPSSIDTIFGPSGLTAFNSGNVAQAQAAVNNLQPVGSTDIRGGLQQGLDVLTAGANQGHRRALIFFSDGEKTAGGDPTEAAFLQQFDTEDVHVYSVGFGTVGGTGYAGIDVNLLQTLTNANPGEPGFFHVTESAVALDKFFVNAVAGAIDAQVVVDPEGDVPAGQSRTVGVPLGKQDYAVTFILTWDNPASKLHLAVRTPSGFEINAANAGYFGDRVSLTSAPAYMLMAVQLPITVGPNVDQGGRWELVLSNPGRTTVHYSASAISESTIRADMTAPSALVRGGFRPKDPIPFLVTLKQLGGIPILGATVTVTPNVPLASLGSVLSSAGITRAEWAAIAREIKAGITRAEWAAIAREIKGDNLSPAEWLYLALQRRVRGKNLLPRADLPPIELAEARKPGEYLGSFAATRIEGTYSFVVHIEGVTPDCQPFQRELSYSVVVLPDPDPQKTRVTTEWGGPDDPRGSLTVTVIPVVSDGHLLGPGFSSQIRITAKGLLDPASEVVDRSNGSYAQTFRLVDRGVGELRIQVAGIDLPSIALDTALPFLLAATPRSGSNDAAHTIVVSLAEDGDVSRIKNIALVDRNGLVVPLRGFTIDFKRHTVRAKIPRGLDPGLYSVQLESAQGQVPSSKGLTFEVVKRR